jgi:hypothetical protein
MRRKAKITIREEVSLILLSIPFIFANILAFNQNLTPLYLLLLIGVHFLILLITKFDEFQPSPWLHFNRTIEGILIGATPFAGLCYYFTLISEEWTVLAIARAQITWIFCIYMYIYVLFSGLPFIGIYFSIRLFFFWRFQFGNYIQLYDPPIIFSPGSFLFFLMGLGVWFTSTTYFWVVFRKTETFGSKNRQYFQTAKILFIAKTLISIILIIFETELDNFLLKLLPSLA